MTEDEMVGWHHPHNGREFEQALGDSEGHGSLACCSPWSHKGWTDLLNNSFFNCVQKFVLYICICFAALQIGSSVPSLMKFPIDIN